ncbi:MAG: tRNA (guanine(10)-N(2))-dimethyltransferase [Halobacteria archaeon]|nr:tRNA (guanine(10)-N(2))-dimethyltransferase [Halobacteria archaeon]
MEKVTEGEVTVRTTDDVFYNPDMEMNRDITVAVLNAVSGEDDPGETTYADAMTATGIRGVRAAVEAGVDVTMNDRSPDAVDLARSNLEENDADGDVVRSDSNVFMWSKTADVVDVDPFGSPVVFADSAFNSAQSVACFTATDTAPLCGAHSSDRRRYSAVPLNTEYHPEMGLRVLIGALVRTAARHDVAAEPVLSHVSDHYVRTYMSLDTGGKVANASLEGLGYISHCFDCYYRTSSHGMIFDGERDCPNCGSEMRVAGPLWIDSVRDPEFVDEVRDEIERYMGTYKRARKVLRLVRDEIETPTHYDHHKLSKKWGVTPYKIDESVEMIREAGFEASRAHYSGTAIKTDADVDELEEFVGE